MGVKNKTITRLDNLNDPDEGACPFFYVASRDSLNSAGKCMSCDSETYTHPVNCEKYRERRGIK